MCWAHTGDFCAHVVGSVTVVELNLVTLIEPESERALVETEGAASLSDETVEFVRDGLVVDGFNGLDVGSLPDECSAKKRMELLVYVLTTNGIGGHFCFGPQMSKRG